MCKNKIREYRKEKGLTLKELSAELGISTGYLCHLERGTRQNPSFELMKKIAIELGRTIDEIFL